MLFPEFENFLNRNDIIGVAETKTSEDDLITFPGYSFFPKHRIHCVRRSGGLGIFIKDNIVPFVDIIELDSDFLTAIKISKTLVSREEDIIIAFVYLPPEGSNYSNNESLLEIEMVLLPYIDSYRYFYLMGDLNARTGTCNEYLEFDIDRVSIEQYGIDDDVIAYMNNVQELQNHGIACVRKSQDIIRNNYGNKLLQICRNNNLYICNGRLNGDFAGARTCTKGSVIDYLITNIDGLLLVNNFVVHEYSPLFSDVHCAISFVIETPSRTDCENVQICTAYKRWEPSKKEAFVNSIDRYKLFQLNLMLENSVNRRLNKVQIDNFASKIKNIFQQSAKKSFKKYTVLSKKVKNAKPWFGLQCEKSRKRYQAARKNHSVQKSESSKRIMMNASKRYKSIIKQYYTKHIIGLQNKIRKLRTEKPKEYWKLINSIDKKNNNIPISMENMYNYFKTLNSYTLDAEEITSVPEILINPINFDNYQTIDSSQASLNNPISEIEILCAIKSLKLNKSGGADEIVNEHIISTKHLLMPVYVKLFNIILETGIVPSDWVKGNIIPIYKNKGNKLDPANYRPITLLSCIGKVFTAILNNRLSKYLNDNEILNETQSGFRKEYSTIDNIMVLYSLIEYFKSKKSKLYCCFIDFAKAFDNVWRIGLWQKLLKHGVRGKILNVIKNMYSEIKSCVTFNGHSSGFFSCEKGVRQGENLSPLLFAIYMNDLENFMRLNGCTGIDIDMHDENVLIFIKLFVLLYADDTIVMSDNIKDFQEMLYIFNNYCEKWKLKINIEKTKIIIFGDYSRRRTVSFSIAGEEVEIVKDFKYLGVLFTKNGRFVQHIKNLSTIACKAMYLLRKRIVNLHLPVDCQLKLFDQTIVPILLYGSEICGFENLQLLEKIHLNFMRSILKMKNSTPHVMIYGEFGRFPLEIQAKLRMIKYWSKILTGKNSKISYKLYMLLLYLHRNDIYSCKWILCVEKILQDVGLNYIWLNHDIVNVNWVCAEVKNRLQMQFQQKWYTDVQNSSKCINYRIFKTEFKLEKYIIQIEPKYYIPMARFRTTNNRLPIEKGRWEHIERSQRYCTLCNYNILGDEFHYLLECDYFKELRKNYIPRFYLRHVNILKFEKLMTTANIKLLRRLSRFISEILNKF